MTKTDTSTVEQTPWICARSETVRHHWTDPQRLPLLVAEGAS